MTVNIGDRGEHVPRQLSLHTNGEQFVVGLVDVPVNLADIISIKVLGRKSSLRRRWQLLCVPLPKSGKLTLPIKEDTTVQAVSKIDRYQIGAVFVGSGIQEAERETRRQDCLAVQLIRESQTRAEVFPL